MRWVPLLLVIAAVAASAFLLKRKEGSADSQHPEKSASEEEAIPEWAGSESCAACHPDIFGSWQGTAHALTLRDFSSEVVAKPFLGEYFVARDVEQRIGPGPVMECEGPGGGLRRFEVGMVIGLRRIQMFTTTLEDGRIQVLPVFLEVPRKRWFDYADFIFGGPSGFEIPPDSPNSWYTHARNFNSRCGRCHITNYEIGYDADKGIYETRWSERTIGCETCHGPSGRHIEHWRELREGDDPIVNPSKLSVERANHVCGQCHAEGEMIVPGYRPGNDLFEYIDVHGLEDDRHLLPDGRANELIHNLVPTMESRCGPLVCSKCHDPHGRGIPGLLIRPLEDDWMCLQCHGETAEHSHHPEGSEGRRCVGCHMPQMVIEGGHGRIYDHTVSIPSMRNTKDLGLPNACRNCHLEQSPGWEFEPFEKWYPGAEDRNHRNGLAKAVAGGRSGDAGALEALRALAKEKNAIYRAGAFWLLSRFDVDLRRGLEDPHPMVRRAAIQGVAKRDPDALGQVLEGPSMVLRHAAASALAGDFDRMRSDPDLRSRVLAVLTSCAKLRPDRARLHYLLGALHEIGDDRPRALRAYERYLRINPWDRRIAAHTETLR